MRWSVHASTSWRHGATVASGSVRRRAQLAQVRPDLTFVELRGNIDTRLSKIPDGGAIVMAVAALQILGLTDRIAEHLSIDDFVPAVGQGCVAVECRVGDPNARPRSSLRSITRRHVMRSRSSERSSPSSDPGCSLPVGAHAVDGTLRTLPRRSGPWRRGR